MSDLDDTLNPSIARRKYRQCEVCKRGRVHPLERPDSIFDGRCDHCGWFARRDRVIACAVCGGRRIREIHDELIGYPVTCHACDREAYRRVAVALRIGTRCEACRSPCWPVGSACAVCGWDHAPRVELDDEDEPHELTPEQAARRVVRELGADAPMVDLSDAVQALCPCTSVSEWEKWTDRAHDALVSEVCR